MLCLRMCCRGVVQLYLLKETFWWQIRHVTYSPFFLAAAAEDGGEHHTRRSFSSCRYSGRTHLAGPSPAFPLGPVFFFSSIFMVGSLRLFLVCFATVSCRVSQLAPPADSLPPSLPNSSSSSQKLSLTSILSCRSCYRCVCSRQQQIAWAIASGGQLFWAMQ